MYILDRSPFIVIFFSKYFLPVYISSSHIWQSFLILMRSHSRLFLSQILSLIYVKSICHTRGHLDMLFSWSYIFWHFMFKSLIPFELFLLKSAGTVSTFIFILHVDIQLFLHQSLQRPYFPYCIIFVNLPKIN